MHNFKEKFYEFNGTKIKFWQKGSGHPVLFLHGFGLKASSYTNLLNYLSKHFQVIAPDIPGFGESSIPKDIWVFEDYAAYFKKFIDSLEIKKIIIIAHSFGGGIALNLASKSTNISHLILINSTGLEINYRLIYKLFLLSKKTLNNLRFYGLKSFIISQR